MKNIAKEQAIEIAKAMDEKKARDILLIDIADKSVVADLFVVGSGTSDQQVRAIADMVEEAMEDNGINVIRKEGYREGRWIVLDYGDILVHIFHKDEREYYDIERLWGDETNMTKFEDLA